jgi:hypothetical protein
VKFKQTVKLEEMLMLLVVFPSSVPADPSRQVLLCHPSSGLANAWKLGLYTVYNLCEFQGIAQPFKTLS